MKSLKILLGIIIVAVLTLNLTGCENGPSSKIVGTWYYSEDPEDLTIFNADGTGQNTNLGSSDSFVYSYNSKTGVLEFIWDDGIYESYTVWIDGNTLYITDGETVEIYLRK